MKREYPDDQTMEDDDSYKDINAQDDGLPVLCGCGRLFEVHEGFQSMETGHLICGLCHHKEEIREEIQELECQNSALRIDFDNNSKKIENLKLKLI